MKVFIDKVIKESWEDELVDGKSTKCLMVKNRVMGYTRIAKIKDIKKLLHSEHLKWNKEMRERILELQTYKLNKDTEKLVSLDELLDQLKGVK